MEIRRRIAEIRLLSTKGENYIAETRSEHHSQLAIRGRSFFISDTMPLAISYHRIAGGRTDRSIDRIELSHKSDDRHSRKQVSFSMGGRERLEL